MFLLLRMRRNTNNSTSGFKMDLKFGFLVPKTYSYGKLGHKTVFWGHFRAFFVFLLLRMRRNTINSTSGFKMDLKFGFLVPKNIYDVKFCHKNVILTPFCPILRYYSAHGIFGLKFAFFPQVRGKNIFYNSNPLKALHCAKRHVLTHER